MIQTFLGPLLISLCPPPAESRENDRPEPRNDGPWNSMGSHMENDGSWNGLGPNENGPQDNQEVLHKFVTRIVR